MTERKRRRLRLFAVQAAEPEAAAPKVSGVGDLLRAQRERLGWSVPDVAANLKIRRVMIEAIERGRFRDLPGLAYALGFVRAYADLLGLDSGEIVKRFRAEATGIEEHRELNFPQPLGESRLPGGFAISAAMLAAVIAYGIWYATSFTNDGVPQRVTAVPDRLAALAVPAHDPPPSLPTVPTPAPPIAADSSPAVTPVAPAPAPVAPPVASPAAPPAPPREPVIAALPPPAAPAEPSTGKVYGETSSADVRIVIRAQADAWVQIKDPAGNVVFMRIMKAGETYRTPNRPGLLLTAGNAGSLEIKVDGKQVPAIAKGNMIRRDVALDGDKLLAGTAVPDQPRPAATTPPPPPGSGG
jgi:cytoskeleton protein RodZ